MQMAPNVSRVWRSGIVLVLLGGLCVTGIPGCSPASMRRTQSWVADYDTGERLFRDSGRDMLIWYTDPRPGKRDALEKIFEAPVVKRRIHDYVRCRLFRSYEPDRRYVAQFGVERAPALVVVHADGTYAALTGLLTTDKVYRFLTDTTAPGESPVVNRYVPRRAAYNWYDDAEAVQKESRMRNKPVLFVYYKRLSRDWPRLEALLERPEVYGRFADMLHCRIHTLNPAAKVMDTRFGVVKLPTLVVAHPNGTFHTLEMPTRYESIVRFADRYRHGDATAAIPADPQVAQP